MEELDEFYLSLDEQVSSFLSNGLSPIIVGDFNLRLGQDSDPSPVTGPNVLGITASRNCSYLFSFCRKYGYVVANSFFGHYNEQFTWFHPLTKQGHIKDLVLVPRSTIRHFFTKLFVDQSACVGNNDHSLVVAGPRHNSKSRRRSLAICNLKTKPCRREQQPPLNDDETFIRDLKRKDQKSLVSFRWRLPRIPFCKFHRRSPSRLGIHCPYA